MTPTEKLLHLLKIPEPTESALLLDDTVEESGATATPPAAFSEQSVKRIVDKVVARLSKPVLSSSNPERRETMPKPLIIQFTDLLHDCGDVNARPVREFLQRHRNDQTFLERAEVVMDVYQMRDRRPAFSQAQQQNATAEHKVSDTQKIQVQPTQDKP